MTISAAVVNESNFKEAFFLDSGNGVYDLDSMVVTGFVPDSLLTIIRKAYDGIYCFSILPDTMALHWRRDIDYLPIQVAEMKLTAQVYHNSNWVSQVVPFDDTEPTVESEVITAGVRYRIYQTIPDLIGTDHRFGVEWTFTKGTYDLKFLIHSAGKPVRCLFENWVRNASLRSVREDGRGFPTPGEFAGATPTEELNTPVTGTHKYSYLWERATPCEATNGRTFVELFNQNAGLSVG